MDENILSAPHHLTSPQMKKQGSMYELTKRSRTSLPMVALRRQETKREAKKFLRKMDEEHINFKKNPNNNSLIIRDCRNRYYFSHMCSMILAIISTGIFVVEQEIFITYGMQKNKGSRYALLGYAWFVNVLLCVNIYFSFQLKINLLQNEWLMYSLDDLQNSGLWKDMVIEMGLNLICPYPFLAESTYNDIYEGDFNRAKSYFNTPLLCIAIGIRCYHLVRFGLESSEYMNHRAFRVAHCLGVRAGYSFAFKSIFREKSVKIVTVVMLCTAFIFGYMFRICETPLRHLKPGAPPMNIKNSIWVAIVSMTTVGYGDVVPYTGTGSYIGLFCSMVGIQTTVFFLISYQKFLDFEPGQQFSYDLLENLEISDDVRVKAKNHIVSYFKFKHRGTKEANKIFRNTHSKTLTCANICKTKWVEYMNYISAFNLFRTAFRRNSIRRVQSITTMDL